MKHFYKGDRIMAERTVATPEVQQPVTTESTRHDERYMAPPVDIYETPDALVVLADVPGVALEGLDVSVDNHILTIRGRARHTVVGEVTYREYELVNFFRQFELSNQVDQNRITADLKCGVLILQLPKAAEAKPRQIAVRVD
jgi:HSP20 family protein